jgi:hypothetical protein
MGKKNKIKKKKNKSDKINLLSIKMQYQDCHGNLTIFVFYIKHFFIIFQIKYKNCLVYHHA